MQRIRSKQMITKKRSRKMKSKIKMIMKIHNRKKIKSKKNKVMEMI